MRRGRQVDKVDNNICVQETKKIIELYRTDLFREEGNNGND
nr:MAG TPA: hypothetical protein [Caudoviricetes sp.]